MQLKKYSFVINSYYQAKNIILICQKNNIFPIINVKNQMIAKLGTEWLEELINLLEKQYGKNSFSFFVDCKSNYGLFFDLIEKKIRYLKVNTNSHTNKRINQLAKKNKVLLNTKFSIVDLSKNKNIINKIEKLK